MKTKEELNVLKEEVETLNKKFHDLTEEELKQVAGGSFDPYMPCDFIKYDYFTKCPNSESYQMSNYHRCHECPIRTVDNIPPRD